MGLEEDFLTSKWFFDIFAFVDILLGSADHWNEAETKWINLPINKVYARSSFIHEVNFGEHSNGSLAMRVH